MAHIVPRLPDAQAKADMQKHIIILLASLAFLYACDTFVQHTEPPLYAGLDDPGLSLPLAADPEDAFN